MSSDQRTPDRYVPDDLGGVHVRKYPNNPIDARLGRPMVRALGASPGDTVGFGVVARDDTVCGVAHHPPVSETPWTCTVVAEGNVRVSALVLRAMGAEAGDTLVAHEDGERVLIEPADEGVDR